MRLVKSLTGGLKEPDDRQVAGLLALLCLVLGASIASLAAATVTGTERLRNGRGEKGKGRRRLLRYVLVGGGLGATSGVIWAAWSNNAVQSAD